MPVWGWVAVIVLCVLVAVAVTLAATRRRRSAELKRRFGPEYERTVQERGRESAERELDQRRRRVAKLQIRPLAPESRERYAETWRSIQAKFVDDPGGAIADADRVIADVMQERGYPVGDFEQRAADISVDHPRVVEHYRAARALAVRNERGDAGTEDLRIALVHYRELFEELLDQRVRTAGHSVEEVR